MKTSAQLRAEAISKKRSLLMAIRQNKSLAGYSSYSGGHSATERLSIVAECEKKLSELVIPEIKTKIIGYRFEYKSGDYIGAVYNQDEEQSIEQVLWDVEKYDGEKIKRSDMKWEPIIETV